MAPVTGTLQSGTYIVQNVASGRYATLKDANKGTALVASADPQSEDIRWTISKLSNNKYTVMAYVHATYPKVGANPTDGDPVVGRADEYQWDIKQTGKQGDYIITPGSDDMLYWGFANSNVGTGVKLTPHADNKSYWQFTRVTA